MVISNNMLGDEEALGNHIRDNHTSESDILHLYLKF